MGLVHDMYILIWPSPIWLPPFLEIPGPAVDLHQFAPEVSRNMITARGAITSMERCASSQRAL